MDNQAAKELDYVFAMSVKVLIEAMAMQAKNKERERKGEAPAYGEKEFMDLIEANGIHHNAIMARWAGI
jgi:hypothetical protein